MDSNPFESTFQSIRTNLLLNNRVSNIRYIADGSANTLAMAPDYKVKLPYKFFVILIPYIVSRVSENGASVTAPPRDEKIWDY